MNRNAPHFAAHRLASLVLAALACAALLGGVDHLATSAPSDAASAAAGLANAPATAGARG